MKPKKYDYEKLYQKWYKTILPNLCFYLLAIGGVVGAVLSYISEDDILISICVLVSGIISGFLSRFFTAVAISQKVAATDALLAIRDGNNATTADADELPDL